MQDEKEFKSYMSYPIDCHNQLLSTDSCLHPS
jgi:hypothetical protein